MADLQELFSRLKSSAGPSGGTPPPPPQYPANYQPPSVSSPLFSPPIQTPNPHGSGIMSPNISTPSQDSKAANLLNLLRFNGRTPSQSGPLAAMQNIGSAQPAPSIQGVMNGAAQSSVNKPATPQANSAASDFLLNLLNQPSKAATTQGPSTPSVAAKSENAPAQAASTSVEHEAVPERSRESTPLRVFGSAESRESTPFNVASQAKSNGMFTYVNPFEQLSASTPRPKEPVSRSDSPALNGHSSVDNSDAPSATLRSKKIRTEAAPTARSAPAVEATQEASNSTLEAPKPTATMIKQESAEAVPDTWQAADAASESNAIPVYNFPMVPFKSIRIQSKLSASKLNGDGIMDIVRLKKDFDQIDRILVTATQSHIAYAMSKTGGFRIIRQDSGRDKQVFKSSAERIFHIQIKQARDGTGADSVLAAGINGSVFWTRIDISEEDKFGDESLEGKGFIMPPLSIPEENTSGAIVKTRTKMSSRNHDLFAVSKGKSVHLICPSLVRAAYTDPKARTVNATKYFNDKSLKISTGKACKDFAFSEDDTVIATLDKAGRIKFWDIKELAEAAAGPKPANIELKTSMLSFAATMSSEKISPTSIMFVDKERPCVKGVAHRYLLVGFKQNHSLQLWDLGLGKPVQELHFPHEKDSDAICSINYHPKTGIIAVAHPTRNSIYFVHLSAPRYHIPNMDQAKYTQLLATDDPALPKPESTAIMSGIRELSFASKGQLRSIDMLTSPTSAASDTDSDALFELYAMHSTGVTCVTIKKSDLGWTTDNKVTKPVDAEKSGYVSISPIAALSEGSTTSTDSVKENKPDTNGSVPTKTSSDVTERVLAPVEPAPAPAQSKVPTQDQIIDTIEAIMQPSNIAPRPVPAPAKSAPRPQVTNRGASMFLPEVVVMDKPPSPVSMPILASAPVMPPVSSAPAPSIATAAAPVNGLSSLTDTLTAEFGSLYRKIEGDRRIQDAAANARQDAILKLVSSTLTDNVEASLSKIVASSIQKDVLPTVSAAIASIAEGRLAEVLSQEVKSGLKTAVKAALQDKDCLRTIYEPLSAEVSQRVLVSMEGVVRKTIAPTISQTITASVQQALAESDARQASKRAEQDSKIDRLATMMLALSDSVKAMAVGQAAMQEQLVAMQKQAVKSDGPAPAPVAAQAAPQVVKSEEDEKVEEITALMTAGEFENGTIKWLQSGLQAELFDRLFVRVNPQYLQQLSPLVKLSVTAAVSSSFERHADQRLDWLNIILSSTNLQDPEIAAVAPKIMNVLLGRIQGAYMTFSEMNPGDPVLRKLQALSKQIGDYGRMLR